MTDKKINFSVRVRPWIKEKLEKKAAEDDRSRNKVVEIILEDALSDELKPNQ